LTPVCTKSFVGCGFAPDPTGGVFSAPQDPLAGFKGPGTGGGRGRTRGEGSGDEGGSSSFARERKTRKPS